MSAIIDKLTRPVEIQNALETMLRFMIQKGKEQNHPKTGEYIKCLESLEHNEPLYVGISCENPLIRFTLVFPDLLEADKPKVEEE